MIRSAGLRQISVNRGCSQTDSSNFGLLLHLSLLLFLLSTQHGTLVWQENAKRTFWLCWSDLRLAKNSGCQCAQDPLLLTKQAWNIPGFGPMPHTRILEAIAAAVKPSLSFSFSVLLFVLNDIDSPSCELVNVNYAGKNFSLTWQQSNIMALGGIAPWTTWQTYFIIHSLYGSLI